jgi:hypothetical protein
LVSREDFVISHYRQFFLEGGCDQYSVDRILMMHRQRVRPLAGIPGHWQHTISGLPQPLRQAAIEAGRGRTLQFAECDFAGDSQTVIGETAMSPSAMAFLPAALIVCPP